MVHVLVLIMPVVLFIVPYVLVLILSLVILRLTAQIKTKVTEENVMPNEAPFSFILQICFDVALKSCFKKCLNQNSIFPMVQN